MTSYTSVEVSLEFIYIKTIQKSPSSRGPTEQVYVKIMVPSCMIFDFTRLFENEEWVLVNFES